MELALFLLKGILIGLLFGVPVGAVGTMTIQRTLEHGVKGGTYNRAWFFRCGLHLCVHRSVWADFGI